MEGTELTKRNSVYVEKKAKARQMENQVSIPSSKTNFEFIEGSQ